MKWSVEGFRRTLMAVAATTVLASVAAGAGADEGRCVDVVTLGETASEQAHGLTAENSDTISGGLGLPARRLLAPKTDGWEGGRMTFRLKVDPEKPNYVTVRLWGSDVNVNRLILYSGGKQIGYRHLGDIEILDLGSPEPAYNGRFFYRTSPLPVSLTRGKTEVEFEVRSTGRIWAYGQSFEQYQKPMTEPTRGIYRLYTHTDGCFVPPADEKQGEAPATPPVRQEPGPEVLERLEARVNREVAGLLGSDKPLNQMQMQFLARAYHVKWTPAYRKAEVVERLARALDAVYVAYRADPKLAQADPKTPNPDWFGLGPSGDVIRLLAEPLKPFVEGEIEGARGIRRGAGWSEMLRASREWHRRHRRLYTNQSMINDLYGIYLCNRGVAVVDPGNAMAEEDVRRYLYESVGLRPWLGDETDNGPKKPLGDNYFELTAKGLTKELGYVGNYGEVLDWVSTIYDATRPNPWAAGDEKIKAQLVKIARARAAFRYPMLDADGNRAMRLETIVGWRDHEYPGGVVYAQRSSWDGTPLEAAEVTRDVHLVGYVQQMFADNQFFASVEERMKDKGFRVTAGLLGTPDQYDALKAEPLRGQRMPMSAGRPDFVFSDEEDGVVAIKHGEEVFYASLYWRARFSINFLARVHYMTPRFDRIAVVAQETAFEPSGLTYTRPDWTDMGFANGGHKYPGVFHSAHAGEELPIPKAPPGVTLKPGQEDVRAGRGWFYTLRYGPYLVGMNCTTDRTFALKVPADAKSVKELVSGRSDVPAGTEEKVGPRSTVVFYLGQ
jgi:hypothetical protein